jgi:hypothetical protein
MHGTFNLFDGFGIQNTIFQHRRLKGDDLTTIFTNAVHEIRLHQFAATCNGIVYHAGMQRGNHHTISFSHKCQRISPFCCRVAVKAWGRFAINIEACFLIQSKCV